jgi:hypothetical protein
MEVTLRITTEMKVDVQDTNKQDAERTAKTLATLNYMPFWAGLPARGTTTIEAKAEE